MRRATFMTMLVILILLPVIGSARGPRLLNYQGYLADADGNPITGTVSMTFTLHRTYVGDPEVDPESFPVWTETHEAVPVTEGIYNVTLGWETPLFGRMDDQGAPLYPTFSEPYYLQVTINEDEVMLPFRPLASAPYALNATGGMGAMYWGSSLIGTADLSDCEENDVGFSCETRKMTATVSVVPGQPLTLQAVDVDVDVPGDPEEDSMIIHMTHTGWEVGITIIQGDNTYEFEVSPSDPVVTFYEIEGSTFKAMLLMDTLVNITMSKATLKEVTRISSGNIVNAFVKPYTSNRTGIMVFDIVNVGELEADYVVTVTECQGGGRPFAPTLAQTRTLAPTERASVLFALEAVGNLDTSNACYATLKAPDGQQYDRTIVIFDTYRCVDCW